MTHTPTLPNLTVLIVQMTNPLSIRLVTKTDAIRPVKCMSLSKVLRMAKKIIVTKVNKSKLSTQHANLEILQRSHYLTPVPTSFPLVVTTCINQLPPVETTFIN